ncbi:hypothetical protein [Roseomonas sp. AR75]|uniref:hypothetical protein n=1 Tax=Roseomonas sp. AR75 TaxID=2562311 RepID=UPI001485A850|nr:hypothetical protein [Roseomonas sp. AR75]
MTVNRPPGTQPRRPVAVDAAQQGRARMNGIVYIIGAAVIVLAILGFVGFR